MWFAASTNKIHFLEVCNEANCSGSSLSLSLSLLVVTPALFAGAERAQADPNDTVERTVRTTKSGLVIQRVHKGEVTVTTYGTGTPEVGFVADQRVGEASVVVDGAAPARAHQDRVSPTVYEMTMATGDFTPAEACEFAKGMDGYGCRTSAQVMRDRADLSSSRTTLVSAQRVYNSRCFNFETHKGDGEKKSHNCVVRYMDTRGTRYKWIANKMKATGWENNTGWNCDCISGVGIRAEYRHSAAEAVDWSPHEARPYSACRERSVTVQGKRGASYTQTGTVCDDVLMDWHSPAYQYFGSKWKGPEAPRGHSRGTIATSLVRIPRYGTERYGIRAWLRWG